MHLDIHGWTLRLNNAIYEHPFTHLDRPVPGQATTDKGCTVAARHGGIVDPCLGKSSRTGCRNAASSLAYTLLTGYSARTVTLHATSEAPQMAAVS